MPKPLPARALARSTIGETTAWRGLNPRPRRIDPLSGVLSIPGSVKQGAATTGLGIGALEDDP